MALPLRIEADRRSSFRHLRRGRGGASRRVELLVRGTPRWTGCRWPRRWWRSAAAGWRPRPGRSPRCRRTRRASAGSRRSPGCAARPSATDRTGRRRRPESWKTPLRVRYPLWSIEAGRHVERGQVERTGGACRVVKSTPTAWPSSAAASAPARWTRRTRGSRQPRIGLSRRVPSTPPTRLNACALLAPDVEAAEVRILVQRPLVAHDRHLRVRYAGPLARRLVDRVQRRQRVGPRQLAAQLHSGQRVDDRPRVQHREQHAVLRRAHRC